MKKSTKKTLMAVIIMLTFGLSSIAFVATGFLAPQQQQEFKPLESPVVDGGLDPIYRATYTQNGYTWIEYYYTERDEQFLSLLDSLPSTFATANGQPQLIVQKINDQYLDKSNLMLISSALGVREIEDKDPQKIFQALCELLTFTPLECSFRLPESNATGNETKISANETQVNSTVNQT